MSMHKIARYGIILLAWLLAGCSAQKQTVSPSHPPQPSQTPVLAHTSLPSHTIQPHVTIAAPQSTSGSPEQTVEKFGIYEIVFPWVSAGYANPWEQVEASVTFTSPSGSTITIGGFFYATDVWRARFSPFESGNWTWQARISDGAKSQDLSGSFQVVDSTRAGFVRSNPDNQMRWIFDDGTPYYPIGFGDCILGVNGGSPLENFGFDGDIRNASYPEGRRTDVETYLTAYGEAGFNLFRWSVDNCAFGLYQTIDPAGNAYLQQEGIYGDQLVQSLRDHGFRTYMVIFGFFPPFPNGSGNPDQMEAIKRYVKYVVDRYGAYVDFWELMNESPNPPITIDDDWYFQIARYLREIDPYDHPISTNWPRSGLSVIEIISPHWYAKEDELESDLATVTQINEAKSHENKPIIFGEQGNSDQNWDPRSALRMRIRSWTAFFNEAVFIFWNTSCCKDSQGGTASNIYLGPQERGFVRVLQDFVRRLDRRIRPAEIEISDPLRVRGYALSSPTIYSAYLHAFTDHTNPTSGISITFDSPTAGLAEWIDPASGALLGSVNTSAGRQILDVPDFITDVALVINP